MDIVLMETTSNFSTADILTTSQVYEEKQVPLHESVINAIIGILLTLFIIVAQSLVFYMVSSDVRLRHPNNYFMTSLALADILIGLLVVPMWTVQTTIGYWPFGGIPCLIWNIADYSLCAISINTLCYIATDRYFCLAYPLRYPINRSSFIAKVSLGLVWVFTLMMQSVFIAMTHQIEVLQSSRIKCHVHFDAAIMTFVVTSCLLWIPMIYMSFLYVLIFRITQRVVCATPPTPQNLTPVSNSMHSCCNKAINNNINKLTCKHIINSTEPSISDIADSTETSRRVTVKLKRSFVRSQVKAVRTIGLLWWTFTFCWSPVGIAILLNAFHPGFVGPWLMNTGYWLAYLNSLLNPLCYTYGNPQFKDTLTKVFRKAGSQ